MTAAQVRDERAGAARRGQHGPAPRAVHPPAQRRDDDESARRDAGCLAVERDGSHRPDRGARLRRARPGPRGSTDRHRPDHARRPAPARRGRAINDDLLRAVLARVDRGQLVRRRRGLRRPACRSDRDPRPSIGSRRRIHRTSTPPPPSTPPPRTRTDATHGIPADRIERTAPVPGRGPRPRPVPPRQARDPRGGPARAVPRRRSTRRSWARRCRRSSPTSAATSTTTGSSRSTC